MRTTTNITFKKACKIIQRKHSCIVNGVDLSYCNVIEGFNGNDYIELNYIDSEYNKKEYMLDKTYIYKIDDIMHTLDIFNRETATIVCSLQFLRIDMRKL